MFSSVLFHINYKVLQNSFETVVHTARSSLYFGRRWIGVRR